MRRQGWACLAGKQTEEIKGCHSCLCLLEEWEVEIKKEDKELAHLPSMDRKMLVFVEPSLVVSIANILHGEREREQESIKVSAVCERKNEAQNLLIRKVTHVFFAIIFYQFRCKSCKKGRLLKLRKKHKICSFEKFFLAYSHQAALLQNIRKNAGF